MASIPNLAFDLCGICCGFYLMPFHSFFWATFIGKAIIKSAQFPPIETNKQAYEIVDIAYHMNHKDGEIGYYKLISYDENNKTAIMETNNPYPNDFDSGIFLGVFEKQRPTGGYSPTVTYLEKDNGKVEFTIKWS